MKVDLRMSLQPAISLWLMGVQVVEDDVNLSTAIFGNHFVHEIKKLAPSTPGVMPSGYLTRGYIQRREQRGGAMSLITVANPFTALPSGRRR